MLGIWSKIYCKANSGKRVAFWGLAGRKDCISRLCKIALQRSTCYNWGKIDDSDTDWNLCKIAKRLDAEQTAHVSLLSAFRLRQWIQLQVFCTKRDPNCTACPLRSHCEYALSNGRCRTGPKAGLLSPILDRQHCVAQCQRFCLLLFKVCWLQDLEGSKISLDKEMIRWNAWHSREPSLVPTCTWNILSPEKVCKRGHREVRPASAWQAEAECDQDEGRDYKECCKSSDRLQGHTYYRHLR